MTKTSLLACVLAVSALALGGCKKDEKTPEPDKAPAAQVDKAPDKASDKTAKTEPTPGEVEIDELETLIQDKKVAVFDANGDKVREKYGKIPTATLLSGYDFKLDELSENKGDKLVFYCSNTQCSAAPKAAQKAMVAGYSDVNVLPVGVMGWKEAGKNTETVQ
jgi:rhodanese-related sulfurtransferase